MGICCSITSRPVSQAWASNLLQYCASCRRAWHPHAVEFFDEALAQQIKDRPGQADVIQANNVLAHVADLNGVVAGLGALLKPTGVAVIEVPYVKELIDRVEFDTIYHEHLCYFSLSALDYPLPASWTAYYRGRADPYPWRSLRLFAMPLQGAGKQLPQETVQAAFGFWKLRWACRRSISTATSAQESKRCAFTW